MTADWTLRALVLGVSTMLSSGAVRGGPTPDFEQSLDIARPLAPQLSPAADVVVYELTRTNWKENRFDHDLWLVSNNAGSQPKRLTETNATSLAAAWSPDGRTIAYLTDHPPDSSSRGSMQVTLYDRSSGQHKQLTFAPQGVASFRWSPDGKRIAYITSESLSTEDLAENAKNGEQERWPAQQTASRAWEVFTDSVAAPPQPLSPDGYVASEIAYSPDGRSLAIVAQKVTEPELTPNVELFVVHRGTAGWTRLIGGRGILSSPVWAPDGQRVAFRVTEREAYLHTNGRVLAVAAQGGSPELLDPEFDLDPDLVAWTEHGIMMVAYDRTSSRLYMLNPVTKSAAAVSGRAYLLEAPSVSTDGRHIAFLYADEGHAPDVFTSELSAWRPRKLTSTSDQYRALPHSSRQLVHWFAPDGLDIEGILEKPADYDSGRRYPLLVILHGGPDWLDTPYLSPDRIYPAERMMARGALVLRVNYRGSLGYGSRFRTRDVKGMGPAMYADVISGVDYLSSLNLIDPNRVGLMGWSAGGYIAAFATTYGTRFRAVSVGGGITDWTTFYLTSNLPQDPIELLGAPPSSARDAYLKFSPVTYASKGATPTLLQHGALDPRVPLSQAKELYRLLDDQHVPVCLIAFQGQGHQISRPAQMRAAMTQNERWFAHYLWGEPSNATTVGGCE